MVGSVPAFTTHFSFCSALGNCCSKPVGLFRVGLKTQVFTSFLLLALKEILVTVVNVSCTTFRKGRSKLAQSFLEFSLRLRVSVSLKCEEGAMPKSQHTSPFYVKG